MTTLPRRGASGLDHPTQAHPSAVRRPSVSAPLPISGTEQPRENTLDTRALARALREQRVTIIDQSSTPKADYLTIKVKKPSAGMDPRVKDALFIILAYYPILSRRTLTARAQIATLTAEGYKGALALLAPLLHPRARGETPRWLPNVTPAQVSQLVDTLTKTVNR